jgi:hypothetical protein
MQQDVFAAVDALVEGGDAASTIDALIGRFLAEGNYSLVFEARLMKARQRLGLPLIQTEPASSFPAEAQRAYEEEFIAAARQTGALFLGQGNIERAWPYFRAAGDAEPIREAIDRATAGAADADAIIHIAFQEGVHPAKGLELILEKQGMCRAITSFSMTAVQRDRAQCLELLVRSLHRELAGRLASAIEQQEGVRPVTESVAELIAGRDWLFGEWDYYIDNSHLVSVLQYTPEIEDEAVLDLVLELCAYGKQLSPNFQHRGYPSFEEVFVDYAEWARAVRGEADAVGHFRRKLETADPAESGSAPAQALVRLLVRTKNYGEAIEVSQRHLSEVDPRELACPTAMQIAHMAGDREKLMAIARERGDALSYAAAALERVIPERA